jgi:hypothetical protein
VLTQIAAERDGDPNEQSCRIGVGDVFHVADVGQGGFSPTRAPIADNEEGVKRSDPREQLVGPWAILPIESRLPTAQRGYVILGKRAGPLLPEKMTPAWTFYGLANGSARVIMRLRLVEPFSSCRETCWQRGCQSYGGNVGCRHIADDVLIGSKVRYVPNSSAATYFDECPESALASRYSGDRRMCRIAPFRPLADASEIVSGGEKNRPPALRSCYDDRERTGSGYERRSDIRSHRLRHSQKSTAHLQRAGIYKEKTQIVTGSRKAERYKRSKEGRRCPQLLVRQSSMMNT